MRHPDEGTIHAWLDGALPATEAGALEAHVAGCAECAAATAEARGLLAASSRILAALDSVPGGVLPAEAPMMTSGARAAVRARTVRRGLRVSNGVWRAAAGIVLFAVAAWVAERTAERRAPQPQVIAAAYYDTTTYRIPGVVVDAPPRREPTELVVAQAAVPAPRMASPAGGGAALADTLSMTEKRAERLADASANVAEQRIAADTAGVAATRAESRARRAEMSVAVVPEARQDMATDRIAGSRDATRLSIDRAYVDSVLAADSMAIAGLPADEALGLSARRAPSYAAGSAAPAAAPMAPPSAASGAARALNKTRTDSPVMRAAGCWTLDTGSWSPRLRGRETGEALLPRRVELLTRRGMLGDEWGELLLRPAPGEPPFPAGTAATWKVIGHDAYRLTVGDSTRWVVATLTLDADSLSGRARDYQGTPAMIRTAELRGRRVVCRTEP